MMSGVVILKKRYLTRKLQKAEYYVHIVDSTRVVIKLHSSHSLNGYK